MIDNKIIIRLVLIFLPVACFSYLFHEFRHWVTGEILGNDMSFALNRIDPKDGNYVNDRHLLWILMGGPLFTIFQALNFQLINEKYRSIYIFPFVFFPFFMRLLAILFGGFNEQDEPRIASILNIDHYIVPLVVLTILFLLLLRGSYILRTGYQLLGLFCVISTLCTFLVLGTYSLAR